MDILVAKGGELFQFGALRAVEPCWHFDVHPDTQVAMAVAFEVAESFAFQTENGAVLCAGRDSDLRRAVECWHFDVGAQRGLRKTYGHIAQEVISVASENIVRFDVEDDVEVAVRAAVSSAFAVSHRAQTGAGVNSGWNPDLDFGGFLLQA